MASAADDLWILGIHMTKFGKHPEMDLVDLASEAVLGALSDAGVTMKDVGGMGAGLRGGEAGRRRPALRGEPKGRLRGLEPLGPLRGGGAGGRPDRHRDHA